MFVQYKVYSGVFVKHVTHDTHVSTAHVLECDEYFNSNLDNITSMTSTNSKQGNWCDQYKQDNLRTRTADWWSVSVITPCSHTTEQSAQRKQPTVNNNTNKYHYELQKGYCGILNSHKVLSPVGHVAVFHDDITLFQVDLQSPSLHQPPCCLQDLRR